jgi:hypothetical protein
MKKIVKAEKMVEVMDKTAKYSRVLTGYTAT